MKCKNLTKISSQFNLLFETANASEASQREIKSGIRALSNDLKNFTPIADEVFSFLDD